MSPRPRIGVSPARADRRPLVARLRAAIDPDGFFAFAIFVPMLFISSLGTIGAVLFTALAMVYVVVRMSQLGEVLAPRMVILVIPAFAVLSTLWSQAPVETLKYSLEFCLTVGFGLLLSAAPRPKAVVWGMFLAFGLYIIAAIAFGQAVDMGNEGQSAFSGLTESKNLLADISSSGLLISLTCFVAGIEDRKPVRAAFTLLIAAAQIYALIEARSAGALMGIGGAIACFIFLLALRPARFAIRLMATAFVSLVAALAVLGYGSSMINDSMSFFDKDPTLTGRTYLWQRAGDFIADNPLLGKGFNAFWLHGNLDAEGLWQYAGITSREGFNFHNTAIEILVHLGWVGLVVLATVAVICAFLLLRRVMTRPTLAACFWMSFIVYDAVRMPIESIGLVPFAFPTVLLFAAFGAAFAARRTVPVARGLHRRHPPRFARPVVARSALRPTRFSF